MEGKELRVLESLKTIEDKRLIDLAISQKLVMKEQAVSTQTRDMAGDGVGRDAENPGGLAESGALGDEGRDGSKKFGSPEPVSEGEGGSGETTSTMAAAVVLYTPTITPTDVVSVTHEVPIRASAVEVAPGVGAVGRLKPTGAAGGSDSRPTHTPKN